MSRLLILLLATSGIVHAECYLRSSTVSKQNSQIERVADMQRTVTPAGDGRVQCRVTFRALIGDKWYTAESEAQGAVADSLDGICSQALNSGRTTVLNSVAGTNITSNQEMMCTDQPIPKNRPTVNVGDAVRVSELQPHPLYRNAFRYRGSVCRWFIESRPEVGNVDMTQGIICRAPEQTVWQVVDKW